MAPTEEELLTEVELLAVDPLTGTMGSDARATVNLFGGQKY